MHKTVSVRANMQRHAWEVWVGMQLYATYPTKPEADKRAEDLMTEQMEEEDRPSDNY